MPSIICQITGIEFVEIPGGSIDILNIGIDSVGNESWIDTICPFLLGKYPVTQTQWEQVVGNNPSGHIHPDSPVECISWNNCQEFIRKIGLLSGKICRLPSEAEWAFAVSCGGMSYVERESGQHPDNAADYYKLAMQHFEQALCCYSTESLKHPGKEGVWCHGEGFRTRPVGQGEPNGFGLHDLGSIVWEWCEDMWRDDFHSIPSDGLSRVGNMNFEFPKWIQSLRGKARLKSIEPDGAWYEDKAGGRTFLTLEKTRRVVRGGALEYSDFLCRIPRMGNYQDWWSPDTGFRLAMTIDS